MKRFLPLVVLLILTSCEQVEQVQERFRDMTPYEAYQESLKEAGLSETALALDWNRAGEAAIQQPSPVSLPFQEQGLITAEEPGAAAYRLTVPRGRRLTAEVNFASEMGTRVFVDLFRVATDEKDPPRQVLSTDSAPGPFIHEPRRKGDFILRLQPELLRGGQYTITLKLEAQLAFPVEGHGMRSIQSTFGVARDGGRRQHHGVDIFARRGTAVIAAAAGQAYRIGVTNRGGKVVWVRDPVRNTRLYYAHLDSQAVANGDKIEIGDTLGFVGNTGNARTTPPHLHFGIYRSGRGAMDPMPFLEPPRGRLSELTADMEQLGDWVRLTSEGVRLRAAPGTQSPVIGDLPRYTTVRVLGGSGDYFRVKLPAGEKGYVAARLTEPVNDPISSQIASSGETLRIRPNQSAPPIARLSSQAELAVYGRYEGYLYVEAPSGHLGWLEITTEEE